MRVWIGTSLLLALLVAAIYVAYVSWNLTDVAMPLTGYVAMWLAIVFMIILDVGLVALMFYSHRHGYDEPPSKPPKGFKWD
jgi:hypothetical protein